jgi:hypothetical protein
MNSGRGARQEAGTSGQLAMFSSLRAELFTMATVPLTTEELPCICSASTGQASQGLGARGHDKACKLYFLGMSLKRSAEVR